MAIDMSSGQKARIVVAGLEAKNGLHMVSTTDGKKYSFFETDQSKTYETEQYIAFRKQDVRVGDVLDITFTPRQYPNKHTGQMSVAYNLDSMTKVKGPEAKEAVKEATVEQEKEKVYRNTSYFISSRLQAGTPFEEVEKEVGKAVALAVKVLNTVNDLYDDSYDALDVGNPITNSGSASDNSDIPF